MTLPGYDAWKLDTPPRYDDADRPEDPADEADGDPAGEEDDD